MINKKSIVNRIIGSFSYSNHKKIIQVFAPINIALCKYWGKRDQELNLPANSSLSLTLGTKGVYLKFGLSATNEDVYVINGELLQDAKVISNFKNFIDLLRPDVDTYYRLDFLLNIPTAAGLASSAAYFAAITKAIAAFYQWDLSATQLSILARLGSGSACRSFWTGFVKWQKGERQDGMDCHGVNLNFTWSQLRIGLNMISSAKKPLSSRVAMAQTLATSKEYYSWLEQSARDLALIEAALATKNFSLLAKTAEDNALAMHALMHSAVPPIDYSLPQTYQEIEKIRALRDQGVGLYFTQDAGPNLKLLFLEKDTEKIQKSFPDLEILAPFADANEQQVILVDENDKELGVCEKTLVHEKGLLHRAFSVFILRENAGKKEVLLQQRSAEKYHSAKLWANSCCSHPAPGEDLISAGKRRLKEEMGIDADLFLLGSFKYRATFANGLIENEYDYVLFGYLNDSQFKINASEVMDYQWLELSVLQQDIQKNSKKYCAWLPQALNIIL